LPAGGYASSRARTGEGTCGPITSTAPTGSASWCGRSRRPVTARRRSSSPSSAPSRWTTSARSSSSTSSG
jgi:hypothetical protein